MYKDKELILPDCDLQYLITITGTTMPLLESPVVSSSK